MTPGGFIGAGPGLFFAKFASSASAARTMPWRGVWAGEIGYLR